MLKRFQNICEMYFDAKDCADSEAQALNEMTNQTN